MKRLAIGLAMLVASPVALAAVITGPTSTQTAPSALATTEIPADLLPVYMAAAETCPGLPWQVLAAIGWVESRHARGTADPATGNVAPPIVGPPLDGRGGVEAIADPSQPDGWAHALGPMQFLSATWARWATFAPDRPPGVAPDVNNAWDAIFTAARYLCGGANQLDDVRAAVRRYNHSDAYVNEVMTKAVAYGAGNRSPVTNALVTGSADAVIAAAMSQLGVPYGWGGEAPGVGFDCSGLVQWAYVQAGIALPRTTQQQVLAGMPVAVENIQPGDLVFTRSYRQGVVTDLGHVAIAVGGGAEIVAPHTGAVVRVQLIDKGAVQAVRRVVA
jgi:cell wall-associated NlpC family hydrolase